MKNEVRAKTPEEMRAAREKLFANPEIFCPDGRQYQRAMVRGKIKRTTDCPDCAVRAKKQKCEAKAAKRVAERARVNQERNENDNVKFNRQRQRVRWEEILQLTKALPLVTVDQERKRQDGLLGSELVMSLDGRTQQPFDEKLIPDGAWLVGDVTSLWHRNPRSSAQHWLTREMLEAMILRLVLRRIEVRSIPNKDAMKARFTMFGEDGEEGSLGKGYDAMALWLYLKDRPNVLLSATRPVIRMLQQRTRTTVPRAPICPPELLETPARQVEGDWRFSEAWRPREVLDRVELAMVGAPKCHYFENTNIRKVLAVYLSVRDPQGNLRPWAANTKSIMHDVLRLDGRHRGQKDAGNSMRACLRNVGNGNTPQDLNNSDREIRELIRHFQREARTHLKVPGAPNKPCGLSSFDAQKESDA